jgi:hypothetical protein
MTVKPLRHFLNMTIKYKTIYDHTKDMAAANSSYPKVAVQCLNQALCLYQSLCLVDSEVLRNRHLRVAAKRWQQ